jgi:hypothetical protein
MLCSRRLRDNHVNALHINSSGDRSDVALQQHQDPSSPNPSEFANEKKKPDDCRMYKTCTRSYRMQKSYA